MLAGRKRQRPSPNLQGKTKRRHHGKQPPSTRKRKQKDWDIDVSDDRALDELFNSIGLPRIVGGILPPSTPDDNDEVASATRQTPGRKARERIPPEILAVKFHSLPYIQEVEFVRVHIEQQQNAVSAKPNTVEETQSTKSEPNKRIKEERRSSSVIKRKYETSNNNRIDRLVLLNRYPRFLSFLRSSTTNDTTRRKDSEQQYNIEPRQRSLVWILQFIEYAFDSVAKDKPWVATLGRWTDTPQQTAPPDSPSTIGNEEEEEQKNPPKNQSANKDDNDDNNKPPLMKCELLKPFPLLVLDMIHTVYGVYGLVEQICIDVVSMIDSLCDIHLEIYVFRNLLQEIWDQKHLEVYMRIRQHISTPFGSTCLHKIPSTLNRNDFNSKHAGVVQLVQHASFRDLKGPHAHVSELFVTQKYLHDMCCVVFRSEHIATFLASTSGPIFLAWERIIENARLDNVPPPYVLAPTEWVPYSVVQSVLMGRLGAVSLDLIESVRNIGKPDSRHAAALVRQSAEATVRRTKLMQELGLVTDELTLVQRRRRAQERRLSRDPNNFKIKTKVILLGIEEQTTEFNARALQTKHDRVGKELDNTWTSLMQGTIVRPGESAPRFRHIKCSFPVRLFLYAVHDDMVAFEREQLAKAKAREVFAQRLKSIEEKAALAIQRGFRERQQRRLERDEVNVQADIKREARQRRQQMAQELRQKQEKEMAKHKEKLSKKQTKEEEKQQAIQERRAAIVCRHQQAEVEKRIGMKQGELIKQSLQHWKAFMSVNKRDGKRMRLRWKLWRVFVSQSRKDKNAAAIKLQAMRRRQEGQRRAQQLREINSWQQQRLDDMARLWIGRQTKTAFHGWTLYMVRRRAMQQRMNAALGLSLRQSFERFKRRTFVHSSERHNAATAIQCFSRCAAARADKKDRVHRRIAAVSIQCFWRSCMCRHVAMYARKQQEKGAMKMHKAFGMMKANYTSRAFLAWSLHTTTMKRVRMFTCTSAKQRLEIVFTYWRKFQISQALERANTAVRIQSIFRGRQVRKEIKRHVVFELTVIKIQSNFRGFAARKRVMAYYWEVRAAISIESAWRGHKARCEFLKMMGETTINKIVSKEQYGLAVQAFERGYGAMTDAEGNTMLHQGCAIGSKRVVKLCLRNCIDINVTNHAGHTPLHRLVMSNYQGQYGLGDYLLTKGANPNAVDKDGLTALMLAAATGRLECLELLIEYSNKETRDVKGRTALFLALEHGHDINATILLELGCKVNQCVDSNYDTPVHLAAEKESVLKLAGVVGLCGYDCVSNVVDASGGTALHRAIQADRIENVKLLLEYGVESSTKDNLGRTPLWYAASLGQLETIRVLCEAGLDTDLADNNGNTALHEGVMHNHVELTSLLLVNAANTAVQNNKGNMPVHIAAINCNVEIVDMLTDYDCEMNTRNFEGRTPLGEARMSGSGGAAVVACITGKYLIQDVETKEQREESRKANAITGLMGRQRLWKAEQQQTTSLSSIETEKEAVSSSDYNYSMDKSDVRTHGGSEDVQHQEEEKKMEELTDTQWSEKLAQSKLVFELGVLADVGWECRIDTDSQIEFWHNRHSGKCQRKAPQEVKDLPQTNADWQQSLDETTGLYVFENVCTGERVLDRPPPARGGKVLKKRPRKIERFAVGENLNAKDYAAFWDSENKEAQQYAQELNAALVIQRQYRRHVAGVRAWRMRVIQRMAIRLQTKYRQMIAMKEYNARMYTVSLVEWAQRVFRGKKGRNYVMLKREELLRQKAVYQASCTINRVGRGLLARRRFRLFYARKIYPAPETFEHWQRLRESSTFVREYKAWQEYKVREPDVFMYCNQLTKVCFWDKPLTWAKLDKANLREFWSVVLKGFSPAQEHWATRIQNIYRGRRARKQFTILVSGVKLMRGAEQHYMHNPFIQAKSVKDNKLIVSLCNYMMYVHTIECNMNKARLLYQQAVSYMVNRGPDNAFVLLSFACFLAANCEEEFSDILELVARARVADPSGKFFRLAEAGFFRQASIDQPHNAVVLGNYAICLQFYGTTFNSDKVTPSPELDLAEEYYLKAIEADPHNKNVTENFDNMLQRLKGTDQTSHQVFQLRQVEHNEREYKRLHEIAEKKRRAEELSQRAKMIQRHMRGSITRGSFSGTTVGKTLVRIRKSILAPQHGGGGLDNEQRGLLESIQSQANLEKYSSDGSSEDEDYNRSVGNGSIYEDGGDGESTRTARGWERVLDEEGETFFYNAITGESRWDRPTESDLQSKSLELSPELLESSGLQESSIESSIATVSSMWERVVDDDGAEYYYNTSTGETQWEKPTDENINRSTENWEAVEGQDGTMGVYDTTQGTVFRRHSDADSVGRGAIWQRFNDENGFEYFHNAATGESKWRLDDNSVGDTAAQDDQNSESFEVGAYVFGYLHGEDWAPARVSQVHFNEDEEDKVYMFEYDLTYDNGEVESHVPTIYLAVREAPALDAGTVVWCTSPERPDVVFSGLIVGIERESSTNESAENGAEEEKSVKWYRVLYDDGEENDQVDPQLVSPLFGVSIHWSLKRNGGNYRDVYVNDTSDVAQWRVPFTRPKRRVSSIEIKPTARDLFELVYSASGDSYDRKIEVRSVVDWMSTHALDSSVTELTGFVWNAQLIEMFHYELALLAIDDGSGLTMVDEFMFVHAFNQLTYNLSLKHDTVQLIQKLELLSPLAYTTRADLIKLLITDNLVVDMLRRSSVLSCLLKQKARNALELQLARHATATQPIPSVDILAHALKQVVLDYETVNEAKQLFRLLDKDKSGFVDVQEAKDAMKDSKVIQAFVGVTSNLRGLLDPVVLESTLSCMDTDESGHVSLNEFIAGNVGAQRKAECHADACYLFDLLDADKSGLLTRMEFVKALQDPNGSYDAYLELMGPAVAQLKNPVQFTQTFDKIDTDASGEVSREEFALACCRLLVFK